MTADPILLLVYAHPREGEGLCDGKRVRCRQVGVGPCEAGARSAAAVARLRPTAVLSVGLCGRLPGAPVALRAACRVVRTAAADEGVQTPEGFLPREAVGLGPAPVYRADPGLSGWLGAVAAESGEVRAATVAACAGAGALARARRAAGWDVETMESAAVAAACSAFGVPWAELRVVSNDTGDRAAAAFDLAGAAARLQQLAKAVIAAWEVQPWTR